MGNLSSGSYTLTFTKDGYSTLSIPNLIIEQTDLVQDATLYPSMQFTVVGKAFLAVNQPFTLDYSISGGKAPYTYAITSGQLPSGLTMDTATGQIAGTSTNQGVFEFTIRATDDSAQEMEKAVHLEIFAPSWPMKGHDARRSGQSEFSNMSFGEMKWKFQTGDTVLSSPAIGPDGTVYVGSYDTYFYALYPDGTLKWKFQTGYVASSPAIGADGTIYVGALSDNYLYAVNPNGSLKWKFDIGSPGRNNMGTSPSIDADGTIYITNYSGYLYAINPEGTLKWKYQASSSESSPAIGSDGSIYVGSNDGALYAFHLNQKGVVVGRALDMSSDVGVAASISTNTSATAQARANGNYFILLDPGTYDLTVSLANYQTTVISNVTIQKGQATDLDYSCRV